LGASCDATCAEHGGAASNTALYVGTAAQGGSAAECAQLLDLLGEADAPFSATRDDGLGLGCHLYDSVAYWLSSPAFSSSVADPEAELVCACNN
jgi:hypothetical protein